MLRVLVLDAHTRQGLAVCRGLGRLGHEVGAAAYGCAPIAFFSRYVTRTHLLPDPSGDGAAFGAALVEALESCGYDAIVSCDDPTLARLAWLDLDIPSVPPGGRPFALLTDKIALSDVAAAGGVAYPPTFLASAPGDLETALQSTGLPAVVKADRSATALPGEVLYSKGAVVAWEAAEAQAAAAELTASGFRAIVQQRVWTDHKVNAVIIRRGGLSELRYAHRVLREIPRVGGMGITLKTIAPDSEEAGGSVAALEAVADEAGYEGLVQAEFYVDRKAGKAWLLDVNPRPWGSTWFVEKLGMKVMERAVLSAIRRPQLAPPTYPLGRRFHHGTSEWIWFRERHSPPVAVLALALDARFGDVYEYFDRSDMMPFARHVFRRFRP
jgi:predicted ATP-grasp superfamily ATP-dependent carboligase